MKTYDVAGIGNAVVDVITHAPDMFIDQMGIEKGIMQLIDKDRAQFLYSSMQDRNESPGGSVANTLAGIGALGLSTGFIGRVNSDTLGNFYARAMSESGTDFINAPVEGGELPTSRCMIFVSPDGERSMNTYLGISAELGEDDVPDELPAKILFLEGYLYDKPEGKRAFERAAQLCQQTGGQAGIALSDPFCVDRHRADFQRLVNELDFVIGNVHEWEALYECGLDEALDKGAAAAGLIVCTRSGDDVILRRGDERATAPVHRVDPVDATGAGDQFAAGFLYGLATGQPLEVCGRMGNLAAAEVISHIGARPHADLHKIFRKHRLVK